MAIDTVAKRASIASLGLAFLGPSVVPTGTIGQAERQVVSNSYYGILAGSGSNNLGGTSQLESLSSTGGITTERTLGATSQLEPLTSTGGITLERVLGGTSQLGVITSSGGITVGSQVLGGGKSKRKKNQEAYDRAVEIALQRQRDREAILSEVEAERPLEGLKKPVLKLKKRSPSKEVKRIANIDNDLDRLLAIEFHLQQLELKRREDEALALLLMIA